MCGICGICNSKNPVSDIKCMMEALRHRGPDAEGFAIEEADHVAFGHCRLSILDLSEAGKQPMLSRNKRYLMVFNGEIYNHAKLREMLPERIRKQLKSKTDSEVLLEFLAWEGIEEALKQIRGMFAIALYDRKEKAIYLIRDRAGEKPLYYGFIDRMFVFASELKAVAKTALKNSVTLTLDQDAIKMYLRHSYIPAPYTIYKEIRKAESAAIVKIQYPFRKSEESGCYWKLEKHICRKKADIESAKSELSELLSEAVAEQMVADVPYGAFLSGGIDSSLITAYMQKISKRSVKTFSIGFESEKYDEAPFAKKIADYLGSSHEELYVTDKEAMEVIPQIACIYDEPYADSSQIPVYLVSRLAKENVSVVLTGDAGDELFCGYEHYLLTADYYKKIHKLPDCIRLVVGRILDSRILEPVNRRTFNNKVHKLARLLHASDFTHFYYEMIRIDTDRNPLLKRDIASDYFIRFTSQMQDQDPLFVMQFLDFYTYLTNDILVKVDRAAMRSSLETRAPLLDQRVIEYAYSLPMELKYGRLGQKTILKELLYDEIPIELLDRPKKGFGIPLDDWLRGPLKEWAQQMLDAEELKTLPGFDYEQSVCIWKCHIQKRENYKTILWNMILLSQWLQQNRKYYKV